MITNKCPLPAMVLPWFIRFLLILVVAAAVPKLKDDTCCVTKEHEWPARGVLFVVDYIAGVFGSYPDLTSLQRYTKISSIRIHKDSHFVGVP